MKNNIVPDDPYDFLDWCVDNSFEVDNEKDIKKLDIYLEGIKNHIKSNVESKSVNHQLIISVYKNIVEYYFWKKIKFYSIIALVIFGVYILCKYL